MTDFVTQRGIRCLNCDTELYSNSVHDWESCRCDPDDIEVGCFIDGGFAYMRTGGDPASYVEISRVVDRDQLPRTYRAERDAG